jgi:hypothetical protein
VASSASRHQANTSAGEMIRSGESAAPKKMPGAGSPPITPLSSTKCTSSSRPASKMTRATASGRPMPMLTFAPRRSVDKSVAAASRANTSSAALRRAVTRARVLIVCVRASASAIETSLSVVTARHGSRW